MRVFKIVLSYDGTDFSGFQRQLNRRTVQEELEKALATFEGAPVTVAGAGRTDAGVHALGQVASFKLGSSSISTAALLRALNAKLPADVRVLAVDGVPDEFHARFSARGKVYRYRISNTPVLSPFQRRYAWHISRTLDLDAMRAAARQLIGEHDFSCFQGDAPAGGGQGRERTRTIFQSDWAEEPVSAGGRLLTYEVAGSGFLKYMVRNVIGTLVEVGDARRTAESIGDLLRSGTRGSAGPTAPPAGLYLVRVDYDTARPVSFLERGRRSRE